MKNQPLKGLKVLDLSRVLAGPWCTQLMADLGAEVTKIERHPDGDETRQWGPPFYNKTSAYYLAANRNKKVHLLDYQNPKDLQEVLSLAKSADILVENFLPGKLEKFELDYASLKASNPKLIYGSIRGFAGNTDLSDSPGYDAIVQAMSGLMSVTGTTDGEPVKVGVAVTDLLTGLYLSSGLLAAVIERFRTGKGQHLEVALMDTQVHCLANVISSHLISGQMPQMWGTAHPNIVPYQVFQTKDKPIMLAIGNDKQFWSLCEALGMNWYQDSQFATNPQRVHNRNQLIENMQRVLSKHPRKFWEEKFQGLGFPYGPLQDLQEVVGGQYGQQAGLVKQHPEGYKYIRGPITRRS